MAVIEAVVLLSWAWANPLRFERRPGQIDPASRHPLSSVGRCHPQDDNGVPAIAFVLVLVRISGSDSVASGDCEKCYTLVGRLIGILGSETVASGDFVQRYTRVGRYQID